MNVYRCGSDLGDCIAALAVVRTLGKGHIRLYGTPGTKGFGNGRYQAIKPLIEIQPYVESVSMYDEKEGLDITHDFSGFRDRFNDGDSLIEKQARWIGLPHNSVDLSPWLTIPDVPRHGKIVLCRSTRYTGYLRWHNFWNMRPDQLMFCGFQEELEAFSYNCGPKGPNARYKAQIPFHPTADLLELAKVIKGARLIVCNQGSPLWISMALGTTPILLEAVNDDSIIPRENMRVIRSPGDDLTKKEWAKL